MLPLLLVPSLFLLWCTPISPATVTKVRRHLRTLLAFSVWSLALGRWVVKEHVVMSQGFSEHRIVLGVFFSPHEMNFLQCLVIKLRSVAAQYCKPHNRVPKEGWDWWRLKTVSTIFPPTVPLLSLDHVIWRMQISVVCKEVCLNWEFWVLGSAAHFMIGDYLRRSAEIISEMWVPIICTILTVSSVNCIFLLEHTDQNCLLECPDQYLQFGSFTDVSSFLQEFKGYVFKIMGGCDKQGFPMKQGVLTQGRVRILMHRGMLLLAL